MSYSGVFSLLYCLGAVLRQRKNVRYVHVYKNQFAVTFTE